MKRLMKWPWLCGSFALVLTQVALATDPIWPSADELNQAFDYNVPLNPPPTIDARIFDIENSFTIAFEVFQGNPSLYEPNNTLFYTNNGVMTANDPPFTNDLTSSFASLGCGFRFDQQTTNTLAHQMADTFYNAGTIHCSSIQDGNLVYFGALGNGIITELQANIGQCLANATNIFSPGTILTSANGVIQLTGQKSDFSRGTFSMDPAVNPFLFTGFGSVSSETVATTGYGSVGIDTNGDWNPGVFLTPTTALSSDFPVVPGILSLSNSLSYFDVRGLGTSNVVYRAVFVENLSPTVPYKVYIDANPDAELLGSGTAHVEWDGIYQDPASGSLRTNYLYLSDDYIEGANSTNDLIINGIPENYTLTQSTNVLFTAGQTFAGFQNVFPNAFITNPFAYMNEQIIPGTSATNATPVNPSGSITNLNGQIYLAGTNEMNLNYASIFGGNYLNIYSPTQFDGSAGANIASPYADINVGVTNGFLTVSNLMVANIPQWNGNVQAWSTRWLVVNGGLTNDYRVMLVKSALLPTSPPWVRNLTLHGTNSTVISDALNIYGSMSVDSKALTLTTNGIGAGQTSLDGELNWSNSAVLGNSQFPNLRWLTNNGAIRAANSAAFGTPSSSYGAFINFGSIQDQANTIYAQTFINGGDISNSAGAFILQADSATLTNSVISALGNNISITANSLLMSNLVLRANRGLTLQVSNLLRDSQPPYSGGTNTAVTNASTWWVGTNGTSAGLTLPYKPALGDLLGTTITNYCPASKLMVNTWAGQDRGYSLSGYTNNAAIGRLILDAQGSSFGGTQFQFQGTNSTPGTTNAMYVDYIEFQDFATNFGNGVISNVTFNANNNLVIYYAQAVMNGFSLAERLNHFNGDHFRWISNYAGYYSATNILYPDGNYYTFNMALAQSPDIDSDGDGIVNGQDSTPFFVPDEVQFALSVTNTTPEAARLTWTSIPGWTNYVYYSTNLALPGGGWLLLTNPVSTSAKNVLLDPVTGQTRFYQIHVGQP